MWGLGLSFLQFKSNYFCQPNTWKQSSTPSHHPVPHLLSICRIKSLHSLRVIENAAARILTGTRKYEHIKPILSFLHFLLLLTFRIDFEIALLTFKALNSLATSYVLDLLTPYVLPRALRSSNAPLLKRPQSGLKK